MDQQISITSPIASPEIQGVSVRFFKAPNSDMDAPWHALDDLYRAMRFDRVMRKMAIRQMLSVPGAEAQTVKMPDGPVVIGSDTMARGVIRGGIKALSVLPTFEQDYSRVVADIWSATHSDLDPVTSAWRLLQATGFCRRDGAPAA